MDSHHRMSMKGVRRAKGRDYAYDLAQLVEASRYLEDVRALVAGTGAVYVKAKVRSLRKSIEGAINHARSNIR